MKSIVVSDTNIFIDLWKVDLLEVFFELPLEIHTTDFVINEFTKGDLKTKVFNFYRNNKLIIKELDEDEIEKLFLFSSHQKGLSIADCSVLLYAKENEYVLLTGDHKLRNVATEDGVVVHGMIYVFDVLVSNKILESKEAAQFLKKLSELNSRLPMKEVENRIQKWK